MPRLSPGCRVLRIAPDGVVKQIMTGAGKENKHVLALALLGDELYAATSLAGGIYRISAPAGADPEVTAIYAREDTRATDGMEQPGPESLAVTALATDANGSLYAAAAFPAQLLKLDARGEGTYLSPVLHVSAVAKWGAARLIAKQGAEYVTLDTRSGATGTADGTWEQMVAGGG